MCFIGCSNLSGRNTTMPWNMPFSKPTPLDKAYWWLSVSWTITPEANLRHYSFMLEGLKETQASLAKQGINMVVQLGSPAELALTLGKEASLIVCDRGYLQSPESLAYPGGPHGSLPGGTG